ncbi:MAG: DUF1579 domain-containing protein [Planctomycetaceae bacterium]
MLRSICCLLCVMGLSSGVAADDKASTDLSSAAAQEMFMKLAQPGPQHEQMKSLVGRWACHCRNFEGTAGEPQAWSAESEFKLILGGRYLQQTLDGEMPGGIPYAGQGLSGFDNSQQKYVGTWVDSMGTGILQMQGEFDEATNTMTETAVSQTPAGEMQFKMVTRYISQDEFRFVLSLSTPMGDQKMMEIDYRRKK